MDSTVTSSRSAVPGQACYSEKGRAAARQAVERAAKKIPDSEKRAILYDGLEALSKDTESTSTEKMLAAFAKCNQGDGIGDREIVALRTIALDAVAKAVPGTTGVVLATIALEAMNSMPGDRASRALLYGALDSVAKDQSSPDQEKKIAAFGSSLSMGNLSDRDVVTVRKAAAAAIVSGGTGPAYLTIARIALDCSLHLSSDAAARSFLFDALDKVLTDPAAGESDRALADIGKNLSAQNMTDMDVICLRSLMLTAIQQNTGSKARVPEIITSAILGALPSMSAPRVTRSLLYEVFNRIGAMESLLPSESALSAFGKGISGGSMTDGEIAGARAAVLKTMVEHRDGAPGKLLPRAAMDSIGAFHSDRAKREFIYYALESIYKSPCCDEGMRKLAEKGMNFVASTDSAVVRTRMQVLQQLCEYRTLEERAREEIEGMADGLMQAGSSPDMEIDDTHVIIDGVKLEKKLQAGE